MWHIWIISSGIIAIISISILYIMNKDKNENLDYRNTFITIMFVSLLILSLSNNGSEKIVPNIVDVSMSKNVKVPF